MLAAKIAWLTTRVLVSFWQIVHHQIPPFLGWHMENWPHTTPPCILSRDWQLLRKIVRRAVAWKLSAVFVSNGDCLHHKMQSEIFALEKTQVPTKIRRQYAGSNWHRMLYFYSHICASKTAENFSKSEIYYFTPYLKYGSKIIFSNGIFLTFFYPMFANCVHTKTMFVQVSEREIFFFTKL